MAANSTIEWTNNTWITLVGCDEVSPGCDNCYARVMSYRQRKMAEAKIARGENPRRHRHYMDVVDEVGNWTGKVNVIPEALTDPLRWPSPGKSLSTA